LNDFEDFIDHLGELIEADKHHSVNPDTYLERGYHNTGHMVISKYDNRPESEREGV